MRGLLAIDRKPEPDQPSVRLFRLLALADRRHVDGFEHPPHRLRIVAAVEMLLGDVLERHFVRWNQVAQPHFIRFEAGFRRDRIQHQFERKADAGSRHAAIGQDRTFIGGRRIGPATIGRHAVGTGQNADDLRGFEACRERIRRIGAGIDGCLAIDAAQLAVAVGIDGDLVMMLAAIGAGAQMLAPVLDPADGEAFIEREPGKADFFGQQNSLVPEAAADVGRDHANAALLDAERVG